MKLLYFAWLKTKAGLGEEEVAAPESVTDVAGLVDWLKSRGENYVAALGDTKSFRVAVNYEYVQLDHPVAPDDEIAFFPPVTGGAS